MPDVCFCVEHQFGQGAYLASRLSARAASRGQVTLLGLNLSRWEDDRLAEEWAMWETFQAAPTETGA